MDYNRSPPTRADSSVYQPPPMELDDMGRSPEPVEAYTLSKLRTDILAEMDMARFSWFQVKVCIVAGVGFFTDAYDIFAISLAVVMIGLIYPGEDCQAKAWGYSMGRSDELLIKLGTPLGNLFGQITFGWLADVVGRKRMYGFELIIIIVSTFGQAVAGNSPGVNIYALLFAWRFFMGLGIGGDYPLSAILASEFASTRYRGRMMTSVFAAQGWGTLTAALAAVVIVSGYHGQFDSFKDRSYDCSKIPSLALHATEFAFIDSMWRILIGFGCVPAAIALYFRLTIPETPRFSLDVEGDLPRAIHDVHADVLSVNTTNDAEVPKFNLRVPSATWKDFRAYFGKLANAKVLFATAYCWFALDMAYYGLGLNQPTVLQHIGIPRTNTNNTFEYLKGIAVGNLLVVAAGQIPGYWASFIFIDSWGRKPLQYMGFIALAIIFLVLGFGYDALQKTPPAQAAFMFFYILANFFFNFGPNVTTFVVPGEVFPTRYRATAHGLSAASGKLGAVIAQIIFHLKPPKSNAEFDYGSGTADTTAIKTSLQVFAFVMLSGAAATYLLPEPKGKSLEELSNEDQKTFVHGSSESAISNHHY
ncbi:phosphate transporter [Crepidotus variabilis]|uniref:Phosphate transporter n=1 Tax=Crepidotus variabilis TaxID=179855 RepID=A0A9P6JPD9_9AGAR|nr:phosphate transporter [Crepidotus variabilis]